MVSDPGISQTAGLSIGCIIAVSLMLISLILLIYELIRSDNHVHSESGQPTPFRQNRFYGTIAGVSEGEFQSSNFLKYYNQTDKCPTNDAIINSLLGLSEVHSIQHPVLQAIQSGNPNFNVLRIYTSNELFGSTVFYDYINTQLRKDDKDKLRNLMPFIRRATDQINHNGPSLNLIVYRGMNLTKNDQGFFIPGKIFRFQGFTSTSTQKYIAEGFGNTVFEIEIHVGCQQVRNVADISHFAIEQEWLFSPYSRFQVQGKHHDLIHLRALDNLV